MRSSYTDDFATRDLKPGDGCELMHLNAHGVAGVAVPLHHFIMPDGASGRMIERREYGEPWAVGHIHRGHHAAQFFAIDHAAVDPHQLIVLRTDARPVIGGVGMRQREMPALVEIELPNPVPA